MTFFIITINLSGQKGNICLHAESLEYLKSIEKPKEKNKKNYLKYHNSMATTGTIIVYSTFVHACAVCMHVCCVSFIL